MDSRPNLDEYFLKMLELVASRSTCPRRKVGAIITDLKGVVLAMGYNGVPRGIPHCIDFPCPGSGDSQGDTHRCQAVHAEQNALLQCNELGRAHTLYVSCTPCFTCSKMIAQTGIMRIVARTNYPDGLGMEILSKRRITVIVVPE